MISLQEASVRLLEDGLTIPRVRICTVAAEVIDMIGACYHLTKRQLTITIPTPGIIARPQLMVGIIGVLPISPVNGVVTVVNPLEGEAEFEIVPAERDIYLRGSCYRLKDGTITFDGSLWGSTVRIDYRAMEIGEDGWPLVHEAVIDPVVYSIERRMVHSKTIQAAMVSKPTNNMIIATQRRVDTEYHRMVSYARATISDENVRREVSHG